MTDWHINEKLASAYATGSLGLPAAASLEAHVMGCAPCQSLLRPMASAERLGALWIEVVERMDTPRLGWFERGVHRLGLSESDARLAVSAPALRGAWLLSVVFLLAFSVLAAEAPRTGPDLFLLLAPVLPVLGVGLAYGPWVDATFETTLAAPYSSVRLIILRTGSVLLFTTALVAVAGLVVPGHGTAVVWLLPSAALVAVALALTAWLPALASALLVTVVWAGSVFTVWANGRSLDPLFSRDAQLAALVLLALAIATCAGAHRAQAYDLRRFM